MFVTPKILSNLTVTHEFNMDIWAFGSNVYWRKGT